jgi:hypothetical protein
MDDIVIFGIGGIALVLAFVEVAKAFGLAAKFAGPAAILAGLLIQGAAEGMEAWPEITPYVRWVVLGIMLGLGASGLHSQITYHTNKRYDGIPKGGSKKVKPDIASREAVIAPPGSYEGHTLDIPKGDM